MKYCKKCGSQLEDDMMFCAYCGASQDKKTSTEKAKSDSVRQVRRVSTASKAAHSESGKSGHAANNGVLKGILIALLGIAIVAGIIIAVMFVGKAVKPAIDVEKYVLVTTEGFDGNGIAFINLDRDQIEDFVEENYKKLSEMEVETLVDSINVDASETDKLSNGQEITLKLRYNKKLADDNKIKFAKEEWTYKLGDSDFETVSEIDAFADDYIKVSFSGVAPAAKAEFEFHPVNNDIGVLQYDSDYHVGDPLNAGDSIIVKCVTDENVLLSKGYKLKEKEHTYTFEEDQADVFVGSVDVLGETELATMKKEAEDIINSVISQYNKDKEFVAMGDLKYDGVATMINKNGKDNKVYLVYSIDVTSLTDPNGTESGYFDPVTMYMPVEFRNVVRYRDGKTTYDSVRYDWPWPIQYGNWIGYVLKGYDSADSMFTEIIRKKTDSYNYDLDEGLEKIF